MTRSNVSPVAVAFFVVLAAWLAPAARAQESPLNPPANDNLAAALEVSGTEFQLAADLGGATRESFEPYSPYDLHRTAWWSWTAPEDGIYEWDSSGSSNLVAVRVYESASFDPLHPIADTYRRPVKDGTGWTLQPQAVGSFQANQGSRYVFQLDVTRLYHFSSFIPPTPAGSQPVTVTFRKSGAASSANDHFADRLILSGSSVAFTADLSGATAEPGEPQVSSHTLHRTLWWTWEAPGYGSATIRKRGGGEAPVVGIYGQGDAQPLNLIATSATEFGNMCYREGRGHDAVEWDTAPGGRYEIQVDRFPNFDASTPAELELVFAPAPANDSPEGATLIDGMAGSFIATNTASTLRPGEPVIPTQSGSNSVWFKWPAPSGGVLQVTRFEPVQYVDPSYQPTSGVGSESGYEEWRAIIGPSCGNDFVDLQPPPPPLIPVFGLFDQNSTGSGPEALVSWGTNGLIAEVSGQRQYWIQLDGAYGSSGQTPMNLLLIPPPANDNFSNRIVLPSQSLRVSGRTFAATREAADPAYLENNSILERSVWWEWRAPSAGKWTLFVVKGAGDNRFVVYRGTAPATTNEAAGTEWQPVVFDAAAGETFEVGVDARAGFGGNLEFTLSPLVAPTPRMGSLTEYWSLGFGSLTLQFPDNAGLSYVVERSDDLATWTPVFTNANPWSHWIELRTELGKPSEFLRTRLQEGSGP